MLATTSPPDSETFTSTLTSEAYDLIRSFYEGLDRVVYRVAEAIARNRTGIRSPNVVSIDEQDVRLAGERVLAALRGAGLPELERAAGELDKYVHAK
jgi:hypothetical protein